MSQDFINDLPTELLHQVFGYLERDERETVATICKRWSDIIASRIHLETLELKPHHLSSDDNDAKRYRSISIDLPSESYELWTLRRFLRDKVVMGNLEELYINLSEINWHKLFEPQEEFHFPKLRKVTFLKCDQDILVQRKSTTPEWKLGDQIETLVIEDSPSLVLPNAELFPNLRSLTLDNIQNVTYAPGNDSFAMITGRLTELSILKVNGLNLKDIFNNARGLESLSISGHVPMSADTYEAINNMKKLKHLSLIIPIDGKARGLLLPSLRKLTISDDGLILQESVPNLRSLCIGYDSLGRRSKDIEYEFANNFHHRTWRNLFVDNVHASQICTLRNLQTLKMRACEVEFSNVKKICQSIGNLRVLRLQYCTVAGEMILCDEKNKGDACECKMCTGIFNPISYAAYRTSEQLITSFADLRAQYVNCAIVIDGCNLYQQALSMARKVKSRTNHTMEPWKL